jgi:hypothetical protein
LGPGAYLVIVDPDASNQDFTTLRGHWDRAVVGVAGREQRRG